MKSVCEEGCGGFWELGLGLGGFILFYYWILFIVCWLFIGGILFTIILLLLRTIIILFTITPIFILIIIYLISLLFPHNLSLPQLIIQSTPSLHLTGRFTSRNFINRFLFFLRNSIDIIITIFAICSIIIIICCCCCVSCIIHCCIDHLFLKIYSRTHYIQLWGI